MNTRFLRRAVPLALSVSLTLGFAAPAVAAPSKAAEAIAWSFAKDTEGWHYDGKWAYDGDPVAVHDASLGGGALAFDADYRNQKANGWSEVKFGAGASEAQPLDIGLDNRIAFDFFFRPDAMTQGAFQTKVYMKTATGAEVSAVTSIDTKNAADAKNGWKKAHVTVAFDTPDAPLTLLEVNIVGSETDYCGRLAIDNIALSYDDGYVTRTVQPTRQQKIDLAKLETPAQVALTDANAIPAAAKLYSFLSGIADSDYVLYGHMNDLLMHAGPGAAGTSDTYTMLHDYPAVLPIDAMTLAGNDTEYQNHEPPVGAYPPVTGQAAIDRAVAVSERAAKLGGIVSLSAHMPNFAQVAAKGTDANGNYDFSGFTSVVTDGDVVRRVLPGGDLNGVFTAYLDKIAAYGLALQAKNIPVLFRPYHENNGSWFWWGAAHCSASEFKNLFRYTEEYLRDVKGVHNFLYVYSPNGPFTDEADYLTRYPGDAFIDVPGFDMYQEKPQAKDNWMENFAKNMDIVQSFAAKHGKITTIPETGILCGKDTLGRTGAQRLDWFTEALDALSTHKFPYFSTWSNFNADVFDQPYMVDKKRGHEMVDGFTRFYNDPRSIFAGQMPDWQKLDVKTVPAMATYGYLTAPSSNARITKPATVTAKASGAYKIATFRFTNATGKAIAETPAKKTADGTFTASITDALLSSIGKNGGTFHPERLQHFAIYCNTVGDAPVDSHFYLDDIRAVKQ